MPDIGEDRLGLLLLKPDGAASAEVRGRLRDALARHGLEVVKAMPLALAPDDIVAIWPMFGGGAHPVMSALYRRYMTSGPCEALLVGGEEALARCAAIKSELRREFEVCAFENAIHAPADRQEFAANIARLFEGGTASPDATWPEWSKRGRFGAALRLPEAEIDRIAAAIWADRAAAGWDGALRGLTADHVDTCRAVLRPGDPNSIDYGISALFDAFPQLGFETCVRLYIAAEVMGGAVLAGGTQAEMEAIRQGFARHRMTVEIEEAV